VTTGLVSTVVEKWTVGPLPEERMDIGTIRRTSQAKTGTQDGTMSRRNGAREVRDIY
jgi:hypothetical protein